MGYEILFYTVLIIGMLTLFATFYFIPLDTNPDNKNTPAYTYDGDQVIDNNDYGDEVANDTVAINANPNNNDKS